LFEKLRTEKPFKYISVSILLSTIGYLFFILLLNILGSSYYLSAFSISFIVFFFLNHFVYRKLIFLRSMNKFPQSITRYGLVVLSNLLFGNILIFVFVEIWGVDPTFSALAASGVLSPLAYFLNVRWVFSGTNQDA
jgi:putative flippase GtrA